jgi:hypothetical protein
MRVAVFFAAVCFAGAAFAQTAPVAGDTATVQPPASNAGQSTVVVTDEAPAPPPTEKLICRSERPMGSNIARKRVCRTASQIEQDQRNAREMMRHNDRLNGYQAPRPSMGGG